MAINRIAWTIDPFAEDSELQRRTAEAVKALAVEPGVVIEPVSIIHWEDAMLVPPLPLTLEEIRQGAKTVVDSMIRGFDLARALPPTFLVQSDLSLGRAIRRVIQHAKDCGCDLIAVGTHAKKGSTRFLLGSFAESLILSSDIPILVVSPRTKPIERLNAILYPTDLSPKSKEAFPQVVALAKELHATVTLLHYIEFLTRHSPPLVAQPEILLGNAKPEIERRTKQLEALKAEAEKQGVKTQIILQSEGTGTRDAILEHAEKLSPGGLVAMVSQSVATDSVLLGSITRQVIQLAQCPVWVIHPKQKRLT